MTCFASHLTTPASPFSGATHLTSPSLYRIRYILSHGGQTKQSSATFLSGAFAPDHVCSLVVDLVSMSSQVLGHLIMSVFL